MSTYIKQNQPLEYDNAPDWLIAHMRYRRTVLGNTETSVVTTFTNLREFLQWLCFYKKHKGNPRSSEALRSVDILEMPIQTVLSCSRNDIETYLYFTVDVLNNTPKTRSKKLSAIRNFYYYIFDQQQNMGITLASNPAERIRSPKLPRKQPIYLTEADRTSLLNIIDGENGVRDYAIFLLILSCGLRISEVVNINMRDVNLDARTIRIHGKGNKERIAHLTLPCCNAIRHYIVEYRNLIPKESLTTDALFISKLRKDRLTTRSLEQAMQKYVNKAGIGGQGYTPHKLRHTMATILAKDGVDLLAIQKILGHENPGTTQIYTHLGDEDIVRTINNSNIGLLGADADNSELEQDSKRTEVMK